MRGDGTGAPRSAEFAGPGTEREFAQFYAGIAHRPGRRPQGQVFLTAALLVTVKAIAL